MTIRYQLITGLDTDAPHRYVIRDTWEEAADDAVNMGVADWDNHVLLLQYGSQIKAVRE